MNYYNEFDKFAAQWLRNLIKAGHIPHGEVDERSITEVRPADLAGFVQCHFFAGIGGWSHALRLAGWPDDRPVWTGSCSCQPFSVAGKRRGQADERHLWPSMFSLIEKLKPGVVFGEQVASQDGYAWLDLVQADMENAGYAFGPAVLPAAGFGAPHGRHRIFFVADAGHEPERRATDAGEAESGRSLGDVARRSPCGELADTLRAGRPEGRPESRRGQTAGSGSTGVALGDAEQQGLEGFTGDGDDSHEPGRQPAKTHRSTAETGGSGILEHADLSGEHGRPPGGQQSLRDGRDGCSAPVEHSTGEQERIPGQPRQRRETNGHWSDADWIPCRGGKWRPIEPGTFPLAHGVPARMGRLRGYGNAIVPQVAAEVIGAFMEYEIESTRPSAAPQAASTETGVPT